MSTLILQELVNKAQHIVYMESMMLYICCCLGVKHRSSMVTSAVVRVCPHNMCKCRRDKGRRILDPDIVKGLRKIVKKRKEADEWKEDNSLLQQLLRNPEKRKVVKELMQAIS